MYYFYIISLVSKWIGIFVLDYHRRISNLPILCSYWNCRYTHCYIILYGIFSIFFELYLFYFLLLAPGAPIDSLLGIIIDPANPMDIDYKGFVLIFLGLSILTACITGFHFAVKSMKKEETPEIRWKGKFLLIAFLFFGISAIFDALIEMGPILLIFIRIILALAMFLFYLGFILPGWSRKLLSIKE